MGDWNRLRNTSSRVRFASIWLTETMPADSQMDRVRTPQRLRASHNENRKGC
jgi:hypothetical protein